MNRITEITKYDILDLFVNGLENDDFFAPARITYPYYGRLEELQFLERLYELKNMPSLDSRYSDAEGDIRQHTVNNDDYPFCWVFSDERFQLSNGTDEVYLRLLCEIFHPVVRNEKSYWKEFLVAINKLLQNDGYEIYPTGKISNHDIYGWRVYDYTDSHLFVPYSQRNKEAIKDKRIVLSIKRSTRNQIYQLLERFNVVYQKTDDTGWKYSITTSEEVFSDIRQFYVPKSFNEQRQYVETDDLKNFVSNNSPFCVLDAIEFFEKYNQGSDFETKVNTVLKLNGLNLKLDNGKIVNIVDFQIKSKTIAPIQEAGLQELFQEATKYYEEGNLKIGVEKLWDAFERLKTYYSPVLDKKESTNKIISDMSGQKEEYKRLFENEFRELTNIGNNFRIRHHETTKMDIEDSRHYDYFYKRCLSLISVAFGYLEGNRTL